MALRYMAIERGGEWVSVREICDKYQTPFDTQSKVMQLMNHADLLISRSGLHGGYRLKGDLRRWSYRDLHALIEGNDFAESCNGPKEFCDKFKVCNIHHPLQILNARVMEFFGQVNLQELLLHEVR